MSHGISLPGFRFHPTEEELLEFYLKNIVFGKKPRVDIIGLLNIYRHDPWELPGLARIGEREWYFFVQRDRKHGSGGKHNRTTENGFWKATGSDRRIVSLSEPKRLIGLRKTLVFYKGRAPRGSKTDWVMNEYRLPDHICPLSKDIVLCKIYRKATSLKVLEQRAAMEEEAETTKNLTASPVSFSSPPSSVDAISFCTQEEHDQDIIYIRPSTTTTTVNYMSSLKKEKEEEKVEVEVKREEEEKESKMIGLSGSTWQLPLGLEKLSELHVPKLSNMDWTLDQVWSQSNSPNWLQNLNPYYACE